jgi:hypothetical protein
MSVRSLENLRLESGEQGGAPALLPRVRSPRKRASAGALPVVFVFRAAQMLLMLAVLKLTHRTLGASDFIVFNAVLFGIGLASACFSPSLRVLWRTGDPNVALQGGAANILISAVIVGGMFLLNRVLFSEHSLSGALLVTAAAVIYAGCKAVERMIYAYGFTHRRYGAAFSAAYLFVVAELVVSALASTPASLATRLLVPALLFLAVVEARTALFRTVTRNGAQAVISGAARLLRTEYLSRTGILTIGYTVIFTVAGMIERVYPSLLPPGRLAGEAGVIKDYLLVLAYGVAFQSLLSIAVDWARPRIMFEDRVQPRALRTTALTIGLILAACVAGCVIGYPVFRTLGMVPRWFGPALWALILVRFTAQVILFLCQVDLVLTGRLGRASIPWVVVILTEVVMIGGDLSIHTLQRALIAVVVETAVFSAVEGALLARRLRALPA